ncbi:MAG: hypothetical protein AB7O26_13915 [Planctomycetaceae bacterium]
MPVANRFRHQTYTDATPAAPFEMIVAGEQPAAGSVEFRARMRAAGDQFRACGIETIYLVHGTFVGGDALGLWTELARFVPTAAEALAEWSKRRIDAAFGERGNYTAGYAELLEESINRDGAAHIAVKLFRWTSENHHIGRADAAVRLLDEILRESRAMRILLWGHSHAGNVFALLTNLIAGDPESVREFFDAARPFYWRLFGRGVDLPVWESMRTLLERDPRPLAERKIDVVTFGTPIRYGWETEGYSSLLHIVNHKPRDGRPVHVAAFPPTVATIQHAADGDFVHQFGIAGTNVAPGIVAWRAFRADRALNQLLQPDLRARDIQKRLKLGMRVQSEGKTLLVDYGPAAGGPSQHHAGHAIYTDTSRMLFHAEQIAKHLA